jgi:hypothetical protein
MQNVLMLVNIPHERIRVYLLDPKAPLALSPTMQVNLHRFSSVCLFPSLCLPLLSNSSLVSFFSGIIVLLRLLR